MFAIASAALQALGWIEGKNVVFERRYADNRLDRLPKLAAELVSLDVDVIMAAGTLAPLAAKQATATIPITWETYWHAKRFLTACTARQAHKAFALESARSPLPRFSVLRSQARRWRPS